MDDEVLATNTNHMDQQATFVTPTPLISSHHIGSGGRTKRVGLGKELNLAYGVEEAIVVLIMGIKVPTIVAEEGGRRHHQ
jgi:hypothetical protein